MLTKPTLKNINTVAAGTGLSFPSWLAGTAYTSGQTVLFGSTIWTCFVSHTSGTFTVDWLTNGYWINLNDAPGKIIMWGSTTLPAGYLACNGASNLSTTTYATLFAVIGYSFQVTQSGATFSLPSFGGTSPQGIGTSTKIQDNDRHVTYLVGTLGTYSSGVMQAWQLAGVNTSTYYGVLENPDNTEGMGGSASYGVARHKTNYQGAANMLKAFDNGTHGTPTTGHYTKGPTVDVNFIIKY